MTFPTLSFRLRDATYSMALSGIVEILERRNASILPSPVRSECANITGMVLWNGAVVPIVAPIDTRPERGQQRDSGAPMLLIVQGLCGPFAIGCDVLLPLESAADGAVPALGNAVPAATVQYVSPASLDPNAGLSPAR